jgi:CRP/FNR family transcriptional regulator, cyclic AMP receptor protein
MKDEILDALRGMEFFRDFPEESLQHVAENSKIVDFPGRYTIFHESEPAGLVYFIISGQVSLSICVPPVGCRRLTEVGEGELIGWSPLVGRSRLSDTAWTMTPTKAVAIEAQCLLNLCKEDTRFGFEFMQRAAQTLASRLHASRMQLLRTSGQLLPEVQIETD